VFPVKYELRFYIPEDNILHSHRRENLTSYKYYVNFRLVDIGYRQLLDGEYII
jgi:hypothetical protein